MAYIVIIDWDAKDAVPFGTSYTSQIFRKKAECWAYVRRVVERAFITEVQLHNVVVFKTKNRQPNGKAVWCYRDPRKSGDPWPEIGKLW